MTGPTSELPGGPAPTSPARNPAHVVTLVEHHEIVTPVLHCDSLTDLKDMQADLQARYGAWCADHDIEGVDAKLVSALGGADDQLAIRWSVTIARQVNKREPIWSERWRFWSRIFNFLQYRDKHDAEQDSPPLNGVVESGPDQTYDEDGFTEDAAPRHLELVPAWGPEPQHDGTDEHAQPGQPDPEDVDTIEDL